jgi:hypothetical protein
MNKRPLPVTLISFTLIAVGALGLFFHLTEFWTRHPFSYDLLWVSLVRLLAIAAGVYMLRGSNWARWLALAWIAFHVIVSAFHSRFELAVHSLLCAAFAYFLFRPQTSRYFRIFTPHDVPPGTETK